VRFVLGLVVVSAGCAGDASPAGPRAEPAAPVAVAPANRTDAAPTPAAVPDAAIPAIAIEDWPITWTAERTALMLAYRRAHSDPAATDLVIEPRAIVLHYTAGSSAKGTKRYFDRVRIEAERAKLKGAGEVNVSAHFLVDRDGTIYRLQPETRMARHCIGLNHVAIGVENVGDGDRHPLTAAQVDANAALIRYLAAVYPIELVVGHHEARQLDGGPYFVELDPTYRNAKPDPGAAFMAAVRAEIADLALAGPPAP
jgi:N-acetylmuramoyl-L-alanine amidase